MPTSFLWVTLRLSRTEYTNFYYGMISVISLEQSILVFSGSMIRIFTGILFFITATAGLLGQEIKVYTTSKLPFSSGLYDEFAPVSFKNGLIFVSNRRTDFFYTFNNEEQKAPWTIFYVKQRGNGEWAEPDIWEDELKTNANDGPLTIDTEGTVIYFSQNYYGPKGIGNIRDETRVGIFKAEYVNRRRRNIVPFEHNDERYS